MAKERRQRQVNPKATSRRRGEGGPRTEEDKRKAREDGIEAIQQVNEIALEKGVEPLITKDRDSRVTIVEKLDEVKKVEKAKVKELKKLNSQLAENKQQAMATINENKLALTREELKEMGIELKSEIKFGTYSKLSDEQKTLFDKEFSSALMDKAIKLMNNCFDEEKIAKASLKDSAIAMSILIDKMRMLEGKAEKTVEVKHTLTSLINKNSEKKMSDMDFGDIIDVDVVDNEESDGEV